MSIELLHVYRGNCVESIHRGDIVGVDNKGQVLFSYGNKDKRTFWRSAAKPFQIIPMVEAGGVEKFGFNDKELALMTSSHGGEVEHIGILESILNKIGKSVEDLDCGISRPMYEKEYIRLLRENIPFSQGNNPCSGKHSSMLAYGILMGFDLNNYIDKNHPIQRKMLNIISEVTSIDAKDIDIAIDGCGVPVFGLPIYNMALAYAQLSGPFDGNEKRSNTFKRISNAMTAYPYYVAGTSRLDTILMEETKENILAKLGAESVYCMSIMNKGIGIALKIEDGNYRALDLVVTELLYRHEYIDYKEYANIKARLKLEVTNHRKEVVGFYKTVF